MDLYAFAESFSPAKPPIMPPTTEPTIEPIPGNIAVPIAKPAAAPPEPTATELTVVTELILTLLQNSPFVIAPFLYLL